MEAKNVDWITEMDEGPFITQSDLIEEKKDREDAHQWYKPHWPVLRTLRKERLKRQIRQKDIADYLGITVQFYSQIERGINTLSYANAIQIAAWFGMTTDELFEKDYLQSDVLMPSIAEERMKKYKKKENKHLN